jgi:hypothetical protein
MIDEAHFDLEYGADKTELQFSDYSGKENST